MGPQNGSF